MSKNTIEDSQQQSQGTIGTQGNQDMPTPQGIEGSHHSKEDHDDRQIPRQDRSSASNQKEAGNNR